MGLFNRCCLFKNVAENVHSLSSLSFRCFHAVVRPKTGVSATGHTSASAIQCIRQLCLLYVPVTHCLSLQHKLSGTMDYETFQRHTHTHTKFIPLENLINLAKMICSERL